MKKVVYNLLTLLVLPVCIICLCWLIVSSVMKPVNFNNQKAQREARAIERLKDIRTLENAYKSENGHYTLADSLKAFYNEGTITVSMQIGSKDDSVAVENTEAFKKEYARTHAKGAKPSAAEMAAYMAATGKKLVFSSKTKIAVKDTLFNDRDNFNIDAIFEVPFCNGVAVGIDTVTKQVSGVPVPLFQAYIPYDQLLTGMDKQLIINLKAERESQERYEGLMVGSTTTPNNNAGNWE